MTFFQAARPAQPAAACAVFQLTFPGTCGKSTSASGNFSFSTAAFFLPASRASIAWSSSSRQRLKLSAASSACLIVVLKLVPYCCYLLPDTLAIFTQVPNLLFYMRHVRIGRIKLALRLMHAVSGGIMRSAFFLQAFFDTAQARRFPLPRPFAVTGTPFRRAYAAPPLPVCGRTTIDFAPCATRRSDPESGRQPPPVAPDGPTAFPVRGKYRLNAEGFPGYRQDATRSRGGARGIWKSRRLLPEYTQFLRFRLDNA